MLAQFSAPLKICVTHLCFIASRSSVGFLRTSSNVSPMEKPPIHHNFPLLCKATVVKHKSFFIFCPRDLFSFHGPMACSGEEYLRTSPPLFSCPEWLCARMEGQGSSSSSRLHEIRLSFVRSCWNFICCLVMSRVIRSCTLRDEHLKQCIHKFNVESKNNLLLYISLT